MLGDHQERPMIMEDVKSFCIRWIDFALNRSKWTIFREPFANQWA